MDIGRAILEIRKEKELKQEAVALAADTDTGYLSRIEQGRRTPSLAMLERFAAALNTTVSAIVVRAEGLDIALSNESDAGELVSSTDVAQQCRHYVQSLSEKNQRLTLEFVKLLNRLQRNN